MSSFTESQQWVSGMSVESYLDRFFERRGWTVEQTTPHEERVLCLGDRKFYKAGHKLHIEYKSGIQTFYTGNVFLETISVDSTGAPGWVYTCKADYIMYATLLNHRIMVFVPSFLRAHIEDLKRRFREVKTSNGQNDGYDTHGVIVPLDYAETNLACQVLDTAA